MDFYEIIFTKKRLDKTDQFQINESFCAKTPQSRDSAERTLSESLLDLIYKIPNVKYLIHFIMGEKKNSYLRFHFSIGLKLRLVSMDVGCVLLSFLVSHGGVFVTRCSSF